MKRKKSTVKTVTKHLRALADWLDAQGVDDDKKYTAEWLNDHLDVYLHEDAFGTEGQCDPRGDQRD